MLSAQYHADLFRHLPNDLPDDIIDHLFYLEEFIDFVDRF